MKKTLKYIVQQTSIFYNSTFSVFVSIWQVLPHKNRFIFFNFIILYYNVQLKNLKMKIRQLHSGDQNIFVKCVLYVL